MSRVVVVGGGFGGSPRAARLAKLGHDVTLRRGPAHARRRARAARAGRLHLGHRPATHRCCPRCCATCSASPAGRWSASSSWCRSTPCASTASSDGTVLRLPSGSRAAQIAAVDEAFGPAQDKKGRRSRRQARGQPGPPVGRLRRRPRRDWDAAAPRLVRAVRRHRAARRQATEKLLTSRLMLHKAVAAALRGPAAAGPRHPPRRPGRPRPAQRAGVVGHVDYVEQNFGTWTVPGGMGAFAAALTTRLGDAPGRGAHRRHRPSTSSCPARPRRAPGRGQHDRGEVAARPRRGGDRPAPAARPRVVRRAHACRRSRPPSPTSALVGDVPDLPAEVVLHGEYTLTRAHRRPGTARVPRVDGARAAAGSRRTSSRALAAPRARRPRPGRGPRRPVAARPGRAVVRLAVRRAVAGPQHRPRPARPRAPPCPGCTPPAPTPAGAAGCRSWGSPRPWWPRPIGPA